MEGRSWKWWEKQENCRIRKLGSRIIDWKWKSCTQVIGTRSMDKLSHWVHSCGFGRKSARGRVAQILNWRGNDNLLSSSFIYIVHWEIRFIVNWELSAQERNGLWQKEKHGPNECLFGVKKPGQVANCESLLSNPTWGSRSQTRWSLPGLICEATRKWDYQTWRFKDRKSIASAHFDQFIRRSGILIQTKRGIPEGPQAKARFLWSLPGKPKGIEVTPRGTRHTDLYDLILTTLHWSITACKV